MVISNPQNEHLPLVKIDGGKYDGGYGRTTHLISPVPVKQPWNIWVNRSNIPTRYFLCNQAYFVGHTLCQRTSLPLIYLKDDKDRAEKKIDICVIFAKLRSVSGSFSFSNNKD